VSEVLLPSVSSQEGLRDTRSLRQVFAVRETKPGNRGNDWEAWRSVSARLVQCPVSATGVDTHAYNIRVSGSFANETLTRQLRRSSACPPDSREDAARPTVVAFRLTSDESIFAQAGLHCS
jgi:hypothetical protein